MDLSILIPCYRAEAFVAERLAELHAYLERGGLTFEILPVDDGSPDGTAGVLAGLNLAHCHPVLGEPHRGKWGALVAGMARARGRCVLFTDADVPFGHAPVTYCARQILDRDLHIVIGDRTLRESRYAVEMSGWRALATKAYSQLIRLLVTGGLPDTQCGLKAFRADVGKALFPLLRERGFAGDVELLYLALKYELEIKRVPVRLRRQAPSTVSILRHGLAMTRSLMGLPGRYRRGAYDSPALIAIGKQDYWTEEEEEGKPARAGRG